MGVPLIYGTKGVINGDNYNGKPIDYPGKDWLIKKGDLAALPHVIGNSHKIQEAHVFEDIMQLVDLDTQGR